MCEKDIEKASWLLIYVSDNLKAQMMCEKAVEKDPYQLGNVSDNFKTESSR